jgi:hypothetical protein
MLGICMGKNSAKMGCSALVCIAKKNSDLVDPDTSFYPQKLSQMTGLERRQDSRQGAYRSTKPIDIRQRFRRHVSFIENARGEAGFEICQFLGCTTESVTMRARQCRVFSMNA